MRGYASWGRFPHAPPARVAVPWWRDEPLPLPEPGRSLLAYGLGRSYGDACLNGGGVLVDVRRLDRFLAFDPASGLLRAEAGTTLADILALVVPRGWFLPVTPGTKHVTLGGAIANDVHGKNHHRAGSFGRYVTRFELLRSDGARRICSPSEEPELYAATIGGLGLTGLVTWAEIRLRPVAGPGVDVESLRFGSLEEFFPLADASDRTHEYTVAWIDALAPRGRLGRGRFLRADHAPVGSGAEAGGPAAGGTRRGAGVRSRTGGLAVPFDAPSALLSRPLLRAFNALYFRLHPRRAVRRRVALEPFFYPLDRIREWNRLYGRRGFLQYQCVVPPGEREAVGELLERIRRSGLGSFLAVLKLFGPLPSPGILSFPRHGTTLALDFPNAGAPLLRLLDDLDAVVREAGGAVYPAKDARMLPASFRAFFPRWRELARLVDPAFSSTLWRRVTEEGGAAAAADLRRAWGAAAGRSGETARPRGARA